MAVKVVDIFADPGWRVSMTAATLDRDGIFTPGERLERQDDGTVLRTPIGMQGEVLGPPEVVEGPRNG